MADETRRCHYCDEPNGPPPRDLRPYGPGGSWICFPCATSDPEREAAVWAALIALLEGTAAISDGPVVIGGPDGPVPFDEPVVTASKVIGRSGAVVPTAALLLPAFPALTPPAGAGAPHPSRGDDPAGCGNFIGRDGLTGSAAGSPSLPTSPVSAPPETGSPTAVGVRCAVGSPGPSPCTAGPGVFSPGDVTGAAAADAGRSGHVTDNRDVERVAVAISGPAPTAGYGNSLGALVVHLTRSQACSASQPGHARQGAHP